MDALDAFLDELRAAGSAVDAPAPSDALQVLFRDGTVAGSPVLPALPRRRPLVRVAVAGAAGAVAFSGLGVAGALPAPVQSRVADVVEHLGVDWPDGNPGHGGEPPAAPPAADTVREHRKSPPTTAHIDQSNSNAPGEGDDPGANGRHVGQDGGTNPSSSVESDNGRRDDGPGAHPWSNGFYRGWPHTPPTTVDTETQGPADPAAQNNRGGSN